MNRRLKRTGTGLLAGLSLWLASWSAPAGQGGLDTAWQEVGYLNYKKSASLFEKAAKQSEPGSDAWIEATLGLAACLQHRQPDLQQDKERAAELYDRLIEIGAGKPVLPLALMLRARLADQLDYYGDQVDPKTALVCYDRIIAECPDSPLIHPAALFRAQVLINSMDKTKASGAIDWLRQWQAKYPANPLTSMQQMLIAKAYKYPLQQPEKAATAYVAAEEMGLPQGVVVDNYYWRVANLAQQAGDTKTAIRYYERIITEVKRTGFAYEAQLRLKALGVTPPPLFNPFAADNQEGSK